MSRVERLGTPVPVVEVQGAGDVPVGTKILPVGTPCVIEHEGVAWPSVRDVFTEIRVPALGPRRFRARRAELERSIREHPSAA